MDTYRKYSPLHASYAPFINLTISESIFWRNFEDIFSSQVGVWVGSVTGVSSCNCNNEISSVISHNAALCMHIYGEYSMHCWPSFRHQNSLDGQILSL